MGEAVNDKQRALLAAARTVFAREGYHAATVRQIAQEAGVATGTFYLYFSSKEAALLGLIEEFYRLLMASIIEARAGRADILEKLAASVETVVRVFAAQRDLAKIVLIQAVGAHPAFDERLAQVHGDFARLVRQDLDEAAAAGLAAPPDTGVTALALVGSLYEVIISWLRSGYPERLEEAVPTLVTFCLRGIGVSGAGLAPPGI